MEVRRNCFSLLIVVILVAYVVLQNRRLHLINAFIPYVCWSLCVFKILEIYILEHEEKAGGCLHLNDLKQKIRLIRYASLLNIEFYDTFSPRLCIYYLVVRKRILVITVKLTHVCGSIHRTIMPNFIVRMISQRIQIKLV